MFKLGGLFQRKTRETEPSPGQRLDRFHQHFVPDTVAPPAAALDLHLCQERLGHSLPASLVAFLSQHNGGYFSGGLLHVLGATRPLRHQDLATWNQPFDWKAAFAGYELYRYVFFADDVFGNQFGFLPGEADPPVVRFDIHVGEFSEVSPSLSHFLEEMLAADGSWLLGADYLEAYRSEGNDMPVGQQLSLLIPSLLGGSMEPENLRPVEPVINLYLAGQVLTQIKPLPAGTEVRGFRCDPATRSISFEVRNRA